MNVAVRKAGDNGRRHYKALLLDFGSVIQKSFFETRGALERLLKLPSGSLKWAGPFDPAGDTLWLTERGVGKVWSIPMPQ